MKKSIYYIFLIILLVSLIAGVNAKVSIQSSLHETYNLGDEFYITVTTIPVSNYGNLNINLNCENNSVNILKWPVSYFGEQYDYQLPMRTLTKEDLELDNVEEILGNCYLII